MPLPLHPFLKLAGLAVIAFSSVMLTGDAPASAAPPWIFRPGLYSHDPYTGERTSQFAAGPLVESLPDTRWIGSGYSRSRVNQIGPNGSMDSYYRVESWGNGRGGLDAEWERVNDVWQRSVLSGGYGAGGYGYGPGIYGQGGFGGPGGYGPGYGGPGGYGPGFGGQPYGGVPAGGVPGGAIPGGNPYRRW